MITCDETIYVMDFVSTEVVNTISRKMPTNSDGIKVRYKIDSYILNTVLLVIITVFTITIICYHFAKLKNKLLC